jgi:hypothetical protein
MNKRITVAIPPGLAPPHEISDMAYLMKNYYNYLNKDTC